MCDHGVDSFCEWVKRNLLTHLTLWGPHVVMIKNKENAGYEKTNMCIYNYIYIIYIYWYADKIFLTNQITVKIGASSHLVSPQ
jgi:hypothetical protein